MKRVTAYLSLALLAAVGCSEPFDLGERDCTQTYLCVESLLTDFPGVQTVRLTESVPYDSKQAAPAVSGAAVSVSDGTTTVRFEESSAEKGLYCSPRGYCGEQGKTYTLNIEHDGKAYKAKAEMPVFGFDIKGIDYKYTGSLLDSLWTIYVWGNDAPGDNYYLVSAAVNGNSYPLNLSLPVPDYYFDGSIIDAFPIAILSQGAEMESLYGPCAKPLEQGDLLTLVCYEIPRDYFNFIFDMQSNTSAVSIPILTSQPANLYSNIEGDNAVGYFAVCSVRSASCIVDDPYRTTFRSENPF